VRDTVRQNVEQVMDKRSSERLLKGIVRLSCAVLLGAAFAGPARAAEAPEPGEGDDLTSMSLEDLMSIQITSVSKQKQTVAQAPAAITAISQEDIRRSGLNSIPELLRLVPGLDVARINASHWAISSRGFNELYSRQLLVLMDGRSVYTPLFSGVYWDTLDYILPDLDRIEVIRGPGATLWGANAVNGVINITTKSARDTQGLLLSGEYSTIDRIGGVRYGGKIDDDTYYRVYTKYSVTDDFDLPGGGQDHDGWDALRGGFRIDRFVGDRDVLTFQGDGYSIREGQQLNIPILVPPFIQRTPDTANYSGGNLLARWTHTISDKSDFSVQFYYDRLNRSDLQLGYTQDTFDLDFQHRFPLTKRQEIIWGADFRFIADSIKNSAIGQFDPTERDAYIVSGFIQDDFTIVPDRLHFILGTKLETNSYSGFEIQPSARLLWTPNERNSVWAAVSRAVRTPSRWEEDSTLLFATVPTTPAGIPGQINTVGHTDFESEDMWAYELGYRTQATPTLSIDAALFYNDYDKLRSGTVGTPSLSTNPLPPHLLIPINLGNDIDGSTYGFEIAANWNVTPNWRVTGSYSLLFTELHRGFGVDTTNERAFEGTSPRNQAQIHSYYDITKDLEFNAGLYYVENLPTGNIPSYLRLDAGVTWRPKPGLEVTVGVQNALDPQHPEFNSGFFNNQNTEVPRSVYGQIVFRY
jgi:iron complex outermembrane receptor protein